MEVEHEASHWCWCRPRLVDQEYADGMDASDAGRSTTTALEGSEPLSMNPPSEQYPEGTVTIRLHRRKPQHIIMDRRDVDLVLAEELEMQRTENKHLRRKLGEQARYIVFWDGASPGSRNTINHARAMCKPFVVVTP